jgi:hypothetical protein
VDKIKTVAKSFGTFNSPTDGQILYIDPGHEEARVNAPELTFAEAKMAFNLGLIEDPDQSNVVKEDESTETAPEDDPTLLGNVAAARTADVAEDDNKGHEGATSNDSRQSTAWQDADRVQGGVVGTAAVVEDDRPSSDVDAPPASGRRTRKAAEPKEETKA